MGQCGSKDDGAEIKLLDGSVTFKQLVNGTRNFSMTMMITSRPRGAVYKADLQNQIFAVERIGPFRPRLGADEFDKEINFLSSLKHENLLQLLGGYFGNTHLLVIYEYTGNYSSLDDALFGFSRTELDWESRYNICLGIAKGLKYLHEDSGRKFIHGKITSDNILLDGTSKAKIYVGLNLLDVVGENQQFIPTKLDPIRNKVYLAPEYALEGILTVKADVYSFGLLLLQIVSRQEVASFGSNEEAIYLLDVAYALNAKGRLVELIDKRLYRYDEQQAFLILNLALKCTSTSPSLRPAMSEVLSILEGKITIDQTPAAATQPSSRDDNIRSEAYKILTSSSYFNRTRKVTSTKLRSYF